MFGCTWKNAHGAGVPVVRDDGGGGAPLRDAAGARHHDQPGGAGDQ
jgi:hypothetical protein